MGTIKVICKKTGKKFAIETEIMQGRETVVNFVDLKEEEYNALPTVESNLKFLTSQHLLSCNTCHTRSIVSCNCNSKKYICERNTPYSFQCLYCKELKTEVLAGKKSLDELTIRVSNRKADNIGEILTKIGIKWIPFDGNYDCDILFLNCGTQDHVDSTKLNEFVNKGGILYASDWASKWIEQAFPGLITIEVQNQRITIPTVVLDSEIREILGNKINVYFDLPQWHKITSTTGTILLAKDNKKETANKQYAGFPIMVYKEIGKGAVYFTSFHNRKQVSEKETALLELLLLKQIGYATKQSVADLTKLLGLNLKLE